MILNLNVLGYCSKRSKTCSFDILYTTNNDGGPSISKHSFEREYYECLYELGHFYYLIQDDEDLDFAIEQELRYIVIRTGFILELLFFGVDILIY